MAIISQLILLILLFTLLGSVGAYYFKRATSEGIGLHRTFIQNLLVGGAAYGSGALLNIYVLQFLPYTIVFPLTSITYLWTFALASIFLKESITFRKLIGATLIIIGSAFLIM